MMVGFQTVKWNETNELHNITHCTHDCTLYS